MFLCHIIIPKFDIYLRKKGEVLNLKLGSITLLLLVDGIYCSLVILTTEINTQLLALSFQKKPLDCCSCKWFALEKNDMSHGVSSKFIGSYFYCSKIKAKVDLIIDIAVVNHWSCDIIDADREVTCFNLLV